MGARRWIGVAVPFTAMLLAACTAPRGSLTDEWPPLPVPRVSAPPAASCHHHKASLYAQGIVPSLMREVPCDVAHKSETFHVEALTGEHADAAAAPSTGPELRHAYHRCNEAATAFLGGDWHTARAWLNVYVPSDTEWAIGARWLRCDLSEVEGGANVTVDRVASMRDGLRAGRRLAITCAHTLWFDNRVISVIYGDCAEKHAAEFIGAFTVTPAELSRPDDGRLDDQVGRGCWALAARYLGARLIDADAELSVFYWDFKEDWPRGDQTFRCFVGVSDNSRPIPGGTSLRGLGTRPVPRVTG